MVDSQRKREQFLLWKMPKGGMVKSPSPDSEMRAIFFLVASEKQEFLLVERGILVFGIQNSSFTD